jgi:hypothetical protein
LEILVGIGLAGFGAVQLLRVNGLQSGQQLKAEQATEGEGDRALTVRIDVLPIDFHLGAVMEDAFDHGADL